MNQRSQGSLNKPCLWVILALLSVTSSTCKPRNGSGVKAGDFNNDRILEDLVGPRDGTAVTFALTLNPELEKEILSKDYPGPLGQQLLDRLDQLSVPKLWLDPGLQLVQTDTVDKLESATLREFSVQMPLSSSGQNAALTIELNDEDIVTSPLLAKHFLVLAKTGFFTGTEARFFYTTYQGTDVLLLGVNTLSAAAVAPETPKLIETPSGSSPNSAPADPTRTKVAESTEVTPPSPADPAPSEKFETGRLNSAMTAMLGLPKWAILNPIHLINVKQRQLNRSQRTRQLLPGDVFTVDLSEALIAAGQAIDNPSILGSGFFVYLGSQPLLMEASMANNILTFATLAVESRKPLQGAALKFFGRTGAGVSNQSFSLSAASSVIPRGTKPLDMSRDGVNALMRDVLSGRMMFRGRGDKALGFIGGDGAISNALPEKQGIEPRAVLGLYLRKLSALTQAVSVEEARLNSVLEPILANYRAAAEVREDGQIEYKKSGAFVIINEVDAELHQGGYYKKDVFAEVSEYLIHDLGQLQADRFSQSALAVIRKAGGKARELFEHTEDVGLKTQTMLNSFNKFLMRWPLDQANQTNVSDSVKKVGGGFGMVQMLTTDQANASFFQDAADCVVNKKPLAVTKSLMVSGLFTVYPSTEVRRNNLVWFEMEHYRQLLQRLTGKAPPTVRWKNFSLTASASNILNVDELNSYLNGRNATGTSTCQMIYHGLDNLRIDLGGGSFRQNGGPWGRMTETGSSRRWYAPTVKARSEAMAAAQTKRNASLSEFIAELNRVVAALK